MMLEKMLVLINILIIHKHWFGNEITMYGNEKTLSAYILTLQKQRQITRQIQKRFN